MKIHLSRFVCLDTASNLDRMEQEATQAAETGTDLCVFPEGFLHGYTQTLDPTTIRKRLRATSERHPKTAFIFGSFTEARRNRMTVWQAGEELAAYDKVHLFAPNHEARLWDPGHQYVAVKLKGWQIGLVNCNDLRFPEQARLLRLQGKCEALVAIAWWPWRRNHIWETLLRARAIENGIFTAGCCIAASEYPGETFSGAGNYVFDPIGDPVPTPDDRSYVLDKQRGEALLVDPLQTAVAIQDLCLRP